MCTQKEYRIALKAVHKIPQQNGGNAESDGYCTEPKSPRTWPNETRVERYTPDWQQIFFSDGRYAISLYIAMDEIWLNM